MQIERDIVGKFIDASVNNHAEALQLLTLHPNLRSAKWMGDEHLLNFLVIENYLAGVRFCLTHGFDPNQRNGDIGTTPLHYACKLNYSDIAKTLVNSGADPNAICQIDDTPIHCAIRNGNAKLVDFLILNNANPDYKTELGESIFDNWPPWAKTEIETVIEKHGVTREISG